MRLKRLFLLGLIFISIASCGKKEEDTIKIGAILPLTGNAALVGQNAKDALLFAERFLNDSLLKSSNYKINFIVEDGAGNPSTSISVLNKLLSIDKSEIILSIVSPVDLAILPIQKKSNFLFISHATHPKLSNVNNLVFRHSPTVEQEFELLVQSIDPIKNKIILIYNNDDYGVALKKLFNENYPNVKDFALEVNSENQKVLMHKILLSNPSNIILCGNSKVLIPQIKTLRELGYNRNVYTTLGYAATGGLEFFKSDTTIHSINFAEFNIKEENDKVITQFKTQFKRNMGSTEMVFFNTALILAKAIAENKLSPLEISEFIKSTKSFRGIGEDMFVNNSNDILPRIKIY